MSKIEPVSLTRGEMVDLHLDPDCLIHSSRRVAHPVDVRYEDSRVMRDSRGHISVFLGYYNPGQTVAREAMGKEFARVFAEKMRDSGWPSFARLLRNE